MKHLIHIGFAKTGSSYVQAWLSGHPDIAYTPGGIAGLRDIYALQEGAAWDRTERRVRATSHEELTSPVPVPVAGLEDSDSPAIVSPCDAQDAACALLYALFPNAHILIVTRGFRGKLLSAYSQEIRSGGMLGFPAFLDRHRRITCWWDYDHVIGRYEQAFGRDRVLVLPYELLRDNSAAFISRIAGVLEVTPGSVLRRQVNASLSGASLVWYPYLTRYVRRLPLVRGYYRRLVSRDGLAGLAVALQRFRSLPPPRAEDVPDSLLQTLGQAAECLRDRTEYSDYLADYGLSAKETLRRVPG
ncbi:MAG: sulfotransferase domain-containing protein [Alphaproteobacteria bacterium]|nr:sulfotransferase domain-containing protein [Alphaproteobacteria bacterium]